MIDENTKAGINGSYSLTSSQARDTAFFTTHREKQRKQYKKHGQTHTNTRANKQASHYGRRNSTPEEQAHPFQAHNTESKTTIGCY